MRSEAMEPLLSTTSETAEGIELKQTGSHIAGMAYRESSSQGNIGRHQREPLL
jgi:hypothetical protein